MDTDALILTARLMAHYRAQEMKRQDPLVEDPYAELLAGDLSSYLEEHGHFSTNDYSIIRTKFVNENVIGKWCESHGKSNIVLLGAGMDARAYYLEILKLGDHHIIEIDFPTVIRYKTKILDEPVPLARITRLSGDLSDLKWVEAQLSALKTSEIPTLWLMEGVIYYLDQALAEQLLELIRYYSQSESKIFTDMCVPILAELKFGPYTRHFRWGLEFTRIQSFFREFGWDVRAEFADQFAGDRDVGQQGMIFVSGNCTEKEKIDSQTETQLSFLQNRTREKKLILQRIEKMQSEKKINELLHYIRSTTQQFHSDLDFVAQLLDIQENVYEQNREYDKAIHVLRNLGNIRLRQNRREAVVEITERIIKLSKLMTQQRS